MVLAEREELDVFQDDHFMVVFAEHCAIHDGAKTLPIALREKEHCFRIALWGVEQTLSARILAKAGQNRSNSI